MTVPFLLYLTAPSQPTRCGNPGGHSRDGRWEYKGRWLWLRPAPSLWFPLVVSPSSLPTSWSILEAVSRDITSPPVCKDKQFEALVSLLNISSKQHALALCPYAPRRFLGAAEPQSLATDWGCLEKQPFEEVEGTCADRWPSSLTPEVLQQLPGSRLARRMQEASWALGQNEGQQPREDKGASAQGQGLLGPVVWLWGREGSPCLQQQWKHQGKRWKRNK